MRAVPARRALGPQVGLVVRAAELERHEVVDLPVPAVARFQHIVWNEGGCKSRYVGPDGRNHTLWPSFSDAFNRRLARFEEADFVTRTRTGAPVGV
jgi:hypothetical protein